MIHNRYADDTQIYTFARQQNKMKLAAKVDLLEQCTAGVHTWMLHNGLQLNAQKSDVMQFIHFNFKFTCNEHVCQKM